MIHIDDDNVYNFVEHETKKIYVTIDFTKHNINYDLFFDALNKNKNVSELCIDSRHISNDNDVNRFMENFKLPSNITKLSLPPLERISNKVELTSNIEKLSLQRQKDVGNIDFTKNTKLKYIKIMTEISVDTTEFNIPKHVVKFYNGGYIMYKCFKLPQQIQILKLENMTHIFNVVFDENSDLEKIVILDDIFMPPKTDFSQFYNLKIVKIKTQSKQTEFLEKMKLPYGTVVEFY